jgi:hypothetical protein
MQFNMFDWIRQGVKQSVILGVHDAMEAIGTPAGDDARERLAALALSPRSGDAAVLGAETGKRKRLGRSLRDFDGAAE